MRRGTLQEQGRAALVVLGLLLSGGCRTAPGRPGAPARPPFSLPSLLPDPLAAIPNPRTAAEKIVNGAKDEARRGVTYDAAYVQLHYPGGDVPADRGACTDVVVRSLRDAGYDLQELIHQDMRRHFRLYPRKYGLSRPDRNIDHRRTPNQMVFFRRHGVELPLATTGAAAASWKPGDIVYCRLTNGLGHCGVISNERGPSGLPLVIHNMNVTRQEDRLGEWEITGHFRYPAERG